MSKETGGPAFPHIGIGTDEEGMTPCDGMTLRDYFAAKAMQGLLSGELLTADLKTIAKDAYAVADAMLKARNQ